MGVKLAISTEAHSAAGLDNMGFGIDQAWRGWFEPSDIINRQPLAELKELLNDNRDSGLGFQRGGNRFIDPFKPNKFELLARLFWNILKVLSVPRR